MNSSHGTGPERSARPRTATSIRAATAACGCVNWVGPHSAKYWEIEPTRADDVKMPRPMGVRPAATTEPSGTSSMRPTVRRGVRRSRAMPSTATRLTRTPMDHIPWTMAHSQVTGMIHHGTRALLPAAIQAAVTRAMKR
ncbi:hypothetical protein [Nocardioides daphniae]|uniref:Uncharacterized protein n=1 Tax=Nocardioides daphniae TaxID=402297 RepID=A0A4P7UA65_9ACTN|nr:hypothetical protein [Nocardioides daphniae]QCC76972.1 hypothetical protein E2C04_06635 [Nocardioides daphniae]